MKKSKPIIKKGVKSTGKKTAVYDPAKIETKWQKKWQSSRIFRSREDSKKSKYYVLDMFPYPSGEGLHVGHPKGYIATDIISRYKRMQGHSVLHPMGFDAFGLPAENYALKTKTNPADSVKKNVTRYKKQLEILGFDYDWSREINTTDPKYYKWTQWIFLQMLKKGLAYESFEPINWCPSCKTGLANEDIEGGRCERCGTLVEKKPMRQWVLKITDFAGRLLTDLEMRDINGTIFTKTDTDERCFMQVIEPGAIRKDLPFVERNAITAIVKHWSEDKYIGLKWKKVAWQTFITGGIEKDQTPEEAALAEIREETGYQNIKFVKKIGRVHSKFFHVPKQENRHAHFEVLYFELENDERVEVSEKEKSNHEVVWIPRNELEQFITPEAQKYMLAMFLDKSEEFLNSSKPLLDWPESIKILQKNWIGRSEGAIIKFKLVNKNPPFLPTVGTPPLQRGNPQQESPFEKGANEHIRHWVVPSEQRGTGDFANIEVFTTRPDTLFGVTYIVLAPEHKLVQELLSVAENRSEVEAYISSVQNKSEIERTDTGKEKTGVELKGVRAINPANNEDIPVWIADYVLPDYGTGAVMAVPANDLRDFDFAKKFNCEIRPVIMPKRKTQLNATTEQIETVELNANNYENFLSKDTLSAAPVIEPGILINSAQFNGKNSESAMKDITSFVGGQWVTKYKLRDWVFSRQRYWGEPIPVIHCQNCAKIRPESKGIVPVPEKDLPVVLPKVKSYEPTGTGESPLAAIIKWVNVKCPVCKKPAKRETNTMPQWAGSSWYYLRYTDPKNNKALASQKKIDYWLGTGLPRVAHDSERSGVDLYVGGAEHATRHLIYARFWHKFLYDLGLTSTLEPFIKLQHVGLIMGEDGRKMSKRFGNVINPDEIVKTYGADSLRLYEMFMGPFDQQIAWSTQSIIGSRRFIEKVWKMKEKISAIKIDEKTSKTIARIIHQAIQKVSGDIEKLSFNTAISALMIAVNELEKMPSISRKNYEVILKLLAPFTPYFTEELWFGLGNKKSLHISEWPKFDPELIVKNDVTIMVQVNGKIRGSFQAPIDLNNQELEALAMAVPEVKKWLEGKKVTKIIVVPKRLVNIVID